MARTVFNAKKRVEHFMREKSDFIEEKTGIELYYESDYEDIQGYHKKALIGLKEYDIWFGDSACCPQCRVFQYKVGCTFCPYSNTHGLCREDSLDNTYGQIIDRLPIGKKSITDSVGNKVMENFIRWL